MNVFEALLGSGLRRAISCHWYITKVGPLIDRHCGDTINLPTVVSPTLSCSSPFDFIQILWVNNSTPKGIASSGCFGLTPINSLKVRQFTQHIVQVSHHSSERMTIDVLRFDDL